MAAGAAGARLAFRRPSAIPGFGFAFGTTLTWLGIIVLIPLSVLVARASSVGLAGFVGTLADDRVRAALGLSFGLAFVAAATASMFGLLIAWVLTRYRFHGRRLLDAVVDLPFALPTAVAGIALAAIYAPNGWVGALLAPLGIRVAFTPLGIYVALVFVAIPFAVRTVQPLIEEIHPEIEEAAATLGSGRLATIAQVLLPPLLPGILTGFVLAFARAVGEYGSVIFVAGNLPYVSEIAPLLIVIKLEEFDYTGATVIAVIMLMISFAALLAINMIQAFARRRFGHV